MSLSEGKTPNGTTVDAVLVKTKVEGGTCELTCSYPYVCASTSLDEVTRSRAIADFN